MMRNPALHLRLSELKEVLVTFNIAVDDAMLLHLLQYAQKYTPSNRVYFQTKAATKKQLKSVDLFSPNAQIFNATLFELRQELHHKSVMLVNKMDSSYKLIKEIAVFADEFCVAFGLDTRPGFRQYISIGLHLMGRNYNLAKFKYYNQRIIELYKSLQEVKNDPNKENTAQFYAAWFSEMQSRTGLSKELTQLEYVHMVYACQQADQLDANYSNWISAQFDGLAFLDAIPELTQFYGEKAIERYHKYMHKR